MSQALAPPSISFPPDEPVYFRAGAETLFGIHSAPASDHPTTGLIMLPSAERLGYHRNRLGVVLAHRLAGLGHHAFRIDYRGQGESTGTVGRFRLDEPFTDDAVGAAAWLSEHGADRILYAGSCFGARVGLAAALEEPTVAGVILGSLPMTDYAAGERASLKTAQKPLPSLARQALRRKTFRDLRDPDMRALYREAVRAKLRMLRRPAASAKAETEMSLELLRTLRTVIRRRTPLLFLYGESDGAYAQFLAASRVSPLGDLLRTSGDTVEVSVVPGRLHGWLSVPAQEAAMDRICDWIDRVDRRSRPT